MAHNIFENRMFCVGKAWHEVGQRVDKELTSAEAIKASGLDYTLEKRPLFCDNNGENVIAENKMAIYNPINNKIIGIVSDNKYKIIQNIEAFDFFDNVVKTGEAVYNSVGALGNGEKIWLLAKLPSNMLYFGNQDIVEKYLLLTNSHDGKESLYMYFTPIRVVCQNTLNASLKDRSDGISIRHCGNIEAKVKTAREALGLALDFYTNLEANFKAFTEKKLTKDDCEKYFDSVLEINENEDDNSTHKINARDNIKALAERGKGTDIEGVKGSLWGAYNAVTEYADHYKTVRGNRMESLLFGSGAELKKRAFNEALVLIK